MNKWLDEAQAACADYAVGKMRGEYPVKPSIGECQKACRCIYRAVTGQFQPWAMGSATASMKVAIKQKRAIVGDDTANAYHKAVAAGKLVPGACLYMGGNGKYGHVVVAVDFKGDPAESLAGVICLENTSSRSRGPGTVLSKLNAVCGTLGSDRIKAVCPPPEVEA